MKMNLLISLNDLVTNCALSMNSDPAQVNVAIQQAHNKLQSELCRDFYNELKSEYLAGTLSTANTALFDYVKNYLVWQAYSSFIIVGSFSHTKPGFREHTDDNSTPVDNGRITMIKKNAEEQAAFWRGEMMIFLKENIDDYPTYKASDCYTCKRTEMGFSISGAGSKR